MKKLDTSKTAWDFSSLYKGVTDPQIELDRKKVEEENYKFINKWKDRKDYLEDPSVLKEALDEAELIDRMYGDDGKEGYYFGLLSSLNQSDPEIKARINKITDFATKIENDSQFFTLRLAKIPDIKQKEFLNSPVLKDYKHFLEKLFENAKYLLTEPEEKILNLKAPVSHSNWAKMTSAILSKSERKVLDESGKKVTKHFSEILEGLIDNKDKKIRDTAAKALNDIFEQWLDVAENEINSVLQNKKINDDLRKLERPDKSRHVGDDIDTKVVDTLVQVVSGRYEISRKYYELKAKLFNFKKLAYHERNLQFGNVDKEYSYDESVNLIYKVLNSLDEEFGDIFKGYVESGQVDVFPKKDKSSGAFCAHNLMSQPTFILLNYADRLGDILTIAHEVGHGINNEFMKKKQHSLYFGTPVSVAEVASTFMEDFVLQEILREADDELRLAIMMQKLNDDISTVFRQVAFYKFEWDLHTDFRKKGYLSKEEIGKLFQKHMKAYMGGYVSQDKGSENWLIYVNHFRYFFYVYSYSSGF